MIYFCWSLTILFGNWLGRPLHSLDPRIGSSGFVECNLFWKICGILRMCLMFHVCCVVWVWHTKCTRSRQQVYNKYTKSAQQVSNTCPTSAPAVYYKSTTVINNSTQSGQNVCVHSFWYVFDKCPTSVQQESRKCWNSVPHVWMKS